MTTEPKTQQVPLDPVGQEMALAADYFRNRVLVLANANRALIGELGHREAEIERLKDLIREQGERAD